MTSSMPIKPNDLERLYSRTFEEIAIGESASLARTLTAEDIQLFALVSGDVNPLYVDPQFTASTHFNTVFAPGMWGGALISALIGTRLPGPGSVSLGQTLKFLAPVHIDDTLTVSVTVTARDEARQLLTLACSGTNQHGDVVLEGESLVHAASEHIDVHRVSLPGVELHHNADTLSRLLHACRALEPIRVAVVHPCDEVSFEAALDARDAGLIEPVLIGPRSKIEALAAKGGHDLSELIIDDVPHSHAAAQRGAQLAKDGEVEALMKGSLHTDELMSAVVPSAAQLRTKRRITHCFVMQTPFYPRPFIITDAAINIVPTLVEKLDIVRNAIDLAHILGVSNPYVAILAAVETVNPNMPATLDAAALCKMADRGQISGAVLDGPLAFDNAISVAAARIKGIDSPVSGKADILVVPDLESGNMLAKQLEYLGGASSAGIVLGAKVPIVLTSRADSREARIASSAIAKLIAHHYRVTPP
nr:bifunctional enoyl-CoA hydratase/phosphate acetyltransferase [uncultured Pseudomonas sp.]